MQPIKLRDVEALHIEPVRGQPLTNRSDWPCPFCGERKPVAGSYAARVRNRSGAVLERWVHVCAECVPTVPRAPDEARPRV